MWLFGRRKKADTAVGVVEPDATVEVVVSRATGQPSRLRRRPGSVADSVVVGQSGMDVGLADVKPVEPTETKPIKPSKPAKTKTTKTTKTKATKPAKTKPVKQAKTKHTEPVKPVKPVNKINPNNLPPLVNPTPYYYTPSTLNHAGEYTTTTQLYIRVGTNRDLTPEQILELIPTNPLENVKITFTCRQTVITGDPKKRLIRKNAIDSKQSIVQTANSQDTPKEDFTKDAQIQRETELADYDEYETIIGSNEPIACYQITLTITAPNTSLLDEQLAIINKSLNQNHDGAQWDSLAGDQQARTLQTLTPYTPSMYDQTSTGSVYSRMQFDVTPGLLDKQGVLLGNDPMSLTGAPCMLDFRQSINTTSLIAFPANSYMPWYPEKTVSMSSMLAQAAANHLTASGQHRVHHICLNGYNYRDETQGYLRDLGMLEDYSTIHDMRAITVNPLQGYGDIDEVVEVYGRLVDKIVNLFDIMENYKLTQEQRAVIHQAVTQFYFNQNLWRDDAEQYKNRTRIVNIEDPLKYPTMGMFINEFSSLTKAALTENRESRADLIETLSSSLAHGLSTHMSIIGHPTNLQPDTKTQVYYDYTRIDNLLVKQLQFVNTIEWITSQCRKGDTVIIHGADLLYLRTFEMINPLMRATKRHGIRWVLSFDIIETAILGDMRQLDIFSCKGPFYNDLATDVDLLLAGQFTPDELVKFESVFNTQLSDPMRAGLVNRTPNLGMAYRSKDNANHFIHLNTII